MEDVFGQVPTVTKFIALTPPLLMLLDRTGVIDSTQYTFVIDKIRAGEYWRLITSLFYLNRRAGVGTLVELGLPMMFASSELERNYIETKKYLKFVSCLAVLSLLVCFVFQLSYPSLVMYESLIYVAARRRQALIRVVLFDFIDVSEVCSIIAPLITSLLAGDNTGYSLLGGYFVGHLVITKDILAML